MQCWCLSSSREMLPPPCKPHPVCPEGPAAPISQLSWFGQDPCTSCKIGNNKVYSYYRDGHPANTDSGMDQRQTQCPGWMAPCPSPPSWTAFCRFLCDCSGLELHSLPRMEKVEAVLEMLHGALGAFWMNATCNRAIAIQVHTPKLSNNEMLHVMTACPCCSFQV